MLLYPAIDLLKTKVDSKYTLAILSAKRARDLIDDKPRLIEIDNNKPISIATAEIAEDMISFRRLETAAPAEETAAEEVVAEVPAEEAPAAEEAAAEV